MFAIFVLCGSLLARNAIEKSCKISLLLTLTL